MGVRRNQRKLSAAAKKRYVNAVLEMKAKPAAAYAYDKYVTMHDAAFTNDPDTNPAHMGPAFFPWHREFLRLFELDLQAADKALGKDGSITLPYWDWTRDNDADPTKTAGSIWKDNFMGPKGNPVASGPFKAGPAWPLAPLGGDLVRALGDAVIDANVVPTLATDADIKGAMALYGFDYAPWDTTTDPGPSVSAPGSPKVKGAAGGTLAAGIYFVALTYQNANGESLPSISRKVCVGAGCTPPNTNATIEVTSPPARAGATLYNVYVTAPGGAAGTETLQIGPMALGTDANVTSLLAGRARPTLNSTGSFRNAMEGWLPTVDAPHLHNRTHVWVGGTMSDGRSPNDPVFFLHHCNIDRQWARWQFRHPGQQYPLVVPKLGSPGNRPHGLNDAMPPWATTPVDVLNHQTLGYSYDTDPPGVLISVTP
jgi:hypothetical protein